MGQRATIIYLGLAYDNSRILYRPQIAKVPCGIVINGDKVLDMSENLIDGSHGPELWFPHIPKGVLAQFVLYEKNFPSELYAATFEVTSDEGNKAYVWHSDHPHRVFLGTQSFVEYREISLDEVCSEYTSQKLAKRD